MCAEGVLSVAINSPKTLNALNARIIGELRETFTECACKVGCAYRSY
jgi:enoyl-CoA hydratase/carnithine racemase